MSVSTPGFFRRHQRAIWASLYLASIPFFAVVYTFTPHAFYMQNIKLEQAYGTDAQAIVDLACKVLNRGWQTLPSRQLEIDQKIATRGSESPRCSAPLSINLHGDTISFDVGTSIYYPKIQAETPFVLRVTMSLATSQMTATIDSVDYLFARSMKSMIDPSIPQLFWSKELVLPDPNQNSSMSGIAERLELDREITKLMNADAGFTSDLSDNFWRMLYFSAVTITTLGYGDIVPITGEARGWVTAEAIVGIVLIGLFLNSLAP